MQITKENLLADREGLVMQRQGIANTINYIDGLLAFLDRPEASQEVNAPENAQEVSQVMDINQEAAPIEAVQLNAESNQGVIPAESVSVEAMSENPDLGAVQ